MEHSSDTFLMYPWAKTAGSPGPREGIAINALTELMSDCSTFEERVLIDVLISIKQSLRDNRSIIGKRRWSKTKKVYSISRCNGIHWGSRWKLLVKKLMKYTNTLNDSRYCELTRISRKINEVFDRIRKIVWKATSWIKYELQSKQDWSSFVQLSSEITYYHINPANGNLTIVLCASSN